MRNNNLKGLKQAEIFAILAMFFLIIIGHQQLSSPAPGSPITPSPPSPYPARIEIPSDKLSFRTGSALPEGGADLLYNYILDHVVPAMEEQLQDFPDLNMVEVIGHTDGVPIGVSINGDPIAVSGTLDQKYVNELARLDVADNEVTFANLVSKFDGNILKPGSNADLGLIRALIIVKTLQFLQYEGKCNCPEIIVFRAYSAAQLYDSGTELPAAPSNQNLPKRRRIEVHLTRWETSQSQSTGSI